MICKLCKIHPVERSDLSQHIKDEHGISVNDYKKLFNVDSVIDDEVSNKRTETNRKRMKYECDLCLEKFGTERQLQKHYRKSKDSKHSYKLYNESNADEWVDCKICGLRRKKLIDHIKNDHNITKEEYEIKYGSVFGKIYLEVMKENGSSKHESERYIGDKNPFYGKTHTKESRQQITSSLLEDNSKRDKHFNKDRVHTPEACHNIALGHTGERNGMFGKPAAEGSSFGIQGVRKDIDQNISFRSTFEANYARYLQYNKIRFEYEPRCFELVKEDRSKTTYRPDFYLSDTDEYVETKNYERAGFDKIAALKTQYPDVKLSVLYQHSDEWQMIEEEYSELILLWETSKQNLRKTPELYF